MLRVIYFKGNPLTLVGRNLKVGGIASISRLHRKI